jgi:hypothetical protein
MSILEKDRPKTGRAVWGDAPVVPAGGMEIISGEPTNFSEGIRYPQGTTNFDPALNTTEVDMMEVG